ncbi:3-methyl-2-oxobutanoate hydroxymethyltransferase [Candidatus Omnitrophus magneticus]|uniref:3-methyl-2-oxobutanoate hydroxymethyltransferase n=1 Tax=Candidatus Omnitrophus magneticus TaxID=1609969 RepID=A0A0F0CIV6_9BACT|nr:3-methyl-2-oxobutanoate hydroxymethyltransferase [Candidatus Omnitrophus magneticus]
MSEKGNEMPEKFSILDFAKKKQNNEKIIMLTATDYSFAVLLDKSGVDAVLVGDSLGMVSLGYDNTIPVTMDEMIHHAKAVRRGIKNAFLIGDMPFMSYEASDEDAVKNAGRFLKEAYCGAVKLEGGIEIISRVKAIKEAGIPVLGHIGLTPQRISNIGGYKVQGRLPKDAEKLENDAKALEDAGCFAIIIECVPSDVTAKIKKSLKIPLIGIGAGQDTDGQILVLHDLIGLYDRFTPKFVKKYATLGDEIIKAVLTFKEEVEKGLFPSEGNSF